MTTIDPKAPIMVTGATGYVAGVLVKQLLDAGHTVHAPVRNPDNDASTQFLKAVAADAAGTLKFFKADLLQAGSYDEAVQGCELVFHTASPFKVAVKNPQQDLVEPARTGTRNVLESVMRTDSVKRVVLTSSVAAIHSDNTDIQRTGRDQFNETDWNETSTLEYNPYYYSKTLAEKEAWRLQATQSRWDLVVINPSLVIGPGLNPAATSESFTLVKQMGDGTMRPGAPRYGIGAVDVRDVATAHIAAGFTPEASGRYIVSGHNTTLLDLAKTLLPQFGDRYPIPRRAIPKWAIWLFGPIADKKVTRRSVTHNVDVPLRLDNTKGREELGLNYRPLADSMNEFFQQLIDGGILPKR